MKVEREREAHSGSHDFVTIAINNKNSPDIWFLKNTLRDDAENKKIKDLENGQIRYGEPPVA